MKRKALLGLMLVLTATSLVGCQKTTRTLGGTTTLELEPGRKLESITWKDDSLWYLTREMREDEYPETYRFDQSSEWGVFEGTVIVKERE